MDVTFGSIVQKNDSNKELHQLTVHFYPTSLDSSLAQCFLIAEFFSSLLKNYFEHPNFGVQSFSIILNELIENAIKYSADKTEPFSVTLKAYSTHFEIHCQNICDTSRAKRFKQFVNQLQTANLDELFKDQVLKNQDKNESGLGLLLLKKDYFATIGGRIEQHPHQYQLNNVTVQVSLPYTEVTDHTWIKQLTT